jgi:hypothetical protein
MRTSAAAVGAVSAVVLVAFAIAGAQAGLGFELEEVFGAPGGYSGAFEMTVAPRPVRRKHSLPRVHHGKSNLRRCPADVHHAKAARTQTPPQLQCAHPHPPPSLFTYSRRSVNRQVPRGQKGAPILPQVPCTRVFSRVHALRTLDASQSAGQSACRKR